MLFVGLLLFFVLQPLLFTLPFRLEDFILILLVGFFFIPFGLFARILLKTLFYIPSTTREHPTV